MMTLSAYGRLGREPKPITTKTGKAMTVASLAVTVPSREDGETVDATQWVSVTAFGKLADDLARHGKGEMVAVIGRAQLNRYQAQDGAAREDLGLVADSLMSARTSRPAGKRKASSGSSTSSPDPGPEPEFNDDIPF